MTAWAADSAMACEGLRRAAMIADGRRDDNGVVLVLMSCSLFERCCC